MANPSIDRTGPANPASTQITWRVVKDNSAAWTERLKRRVSIETQTFAENVLGTAQATVRVRTGATRDSGQVIQMNELTWAVRFEGAALYLEYGTRNHPAYPFLMPAVVTNQKAYMGRLAMTTQGRVRGAISFLAD